MTDKNIKKSGAYLCGNSKCKRDNCVTSINIHETKKRIEILFYTRDGKIRGSSHAKKYPAK